MNQHQLIQSIMKDILSSPSPIDINDFDIKSPLESIKVQTFNNYEKIIKKTNNNDLELYLPEMFINMLSGVTFFNQYLLLLNMHLEKISSNIHNDKDYIRHLLETSFAHTGKFRGYEKFQNNLPFLSNNLLSALSNESFNQEKINRLKKISIIFIILEEFFRNHQAHGFTHSLIDFFRGFNIGIQPVYLFKDNYLEDFSMYDLKELFYQNDIFRNYIFSNY